MATGFLHLHTTVVILFLVLLVIKTILLFANKAALEKLRSKTKVLDMILGTLILLTGGYLLTIFGTETYLIVKIVVTLAAIPLGIIAFKKENKPMALLALFLFVYVYGVAETDSWKMKPEKIETAAGDAAIMDANSAAALENAKAIYNQVCANCHGEDGKKGVGGAKDLTATEMTNEQIEAIIANGKGVMPKYGNKLSESEIKSLAAYVKTLKTN